MDGTVEDDSRLGALATASPNVNTSQSAALG